VHPHAAVQLFADLDAAVAAVNAQKDRWARLPIANRIALIHECLASCVDQAEAMVTASCKAKGLDHRLAAAAEEWMAGPIPIVRNLRLLAATLAEIDASGAPSVRVTSIRQTAAGQLAVRVFPCDWFDRLLYPGLTTDVWLPRDIDPADVTRNMAGVYRQPMHDRRGRTALVLGAGNVASIGPMDVVHKLFVENAVVVLKMHPVNAYLGPIFERAMRPLISEGVLRIVYGDAAEGWHLVQHEAVDAVHLTGSAAVHDRIVWGETATEQQARRSRGEPRVAKAMTSELGCVTPVILVPGAWSAAEMHYQAENIATMVAHNASCNCNAAKLLVTWNKWPLRAAFLDCVREALGRCRPRPAYYPGAAVKQRAFADAYPEAVRAAPLAEGRLPYVTIFGLDSGTRDRRAFTEEAWSPVLAETPLEAGGEAEFLDAAVRFCNEQVEGTLSVMLLASARSRRRLGRHFDRAVHDLRYGTVAVNHWSAVSFALAVAPWGAYPGHTLDAVGSGIGVVHNTRMFDRPLKTVMSAPFVTRPKPVWFTTNERAAQVAPLMVRFEAAPSWRQVPAIVASAMF
jgi:acyl-CoA reductase-like NAD-dependent aldehyde dehydrogenase